ncbi:MAG: hypothetical protein A2X48_17395 [Lentisphaerae bacterium GWF2_49_21]|nr:MAG: hypothetical protein A2X48_17395 [Lentisphaerae bacterium GWF2_49_21]
MNQLSSKVQFYRSMAMMYDAGLPLSKALAQRHPHPLRKICRGMSEGIDKNGSTMSEQMRSYPWFFTNLECRLVKAGELTGGLDVIFKSLAEWFETRKKLNSRIISGMAYPALLFHFAAFAIPFISFLLGKASIAGTILQIAIFLCPPYLFLLSYLVFTKFKHLFNMDPPLFLSRMALNVPVFGKLFRKMDYARFFGVFSLALDAGLNIKDSINLGADACRNRYIRYIFLQTAGKIDEENCTFTEAFSSFIPPGENGSMEISMIETGEQSGKIPDAARHVASVYQFEAEETLNLVANLVPKIVYIIIVIYMAFTILSFWSQLWGQQNIGPLN